MKKYFFYENTKLKYYFDPSYYLASNSDINKEINLLNITPLEHYIQIGSKEQRNPTAWFQSDFYLETYPDVRATKKDPFSHYLMYGWKEKRLPNNWIDPLFYNEIYTENIPEDIEPLMEYLSKKGPQRKKNLYIVMGIPRSGLTLLTALLGSHPDLTAWHHPHATRKDKGIEPFTNFESITTTYKEAFPQECAAIKNMVISASTADLDNIDFIKKSVKNLTESDVNIHLIWLIRDINHTYVSQMEAAHTYWGAEDININQESYKNYIDFVHQGYIKLIDLALEGNHTSLLSYQNLIKNHEIITERIMQLGNLKFEPEQLNYLSHTNLNNVAGDPGFNKYSNVVSSRQTLRESMDKQTAALQKQIDEKQAEFLQDFNHMHTSVSHSFFSSFNQYTMQVLTDHFNTQYYLDQNQDVKDSQVDPLEHYCQQGWKEERNPTETFQTKIYKENVFYDNKTVPFLHYLLLGKYQITPEQIEAPSTMRNLKIIDPETYKIRDNLMLTAPKFDDLKVSIVIPAYNQQNYTLACIESIIKYTDNVSYEIIVMDDKSPDLEAREIGKYMQNILFHSNVENLGFVRNCNFGASFAKGKYIFFLNNDTNVQPDWLSSLVLLIESSDKIGMVGSRLVYPTGEQQEAGGIVWNDASGWNFGRLDDPYKPEFNYVKEADYLTGAAMMIRRSLWEEIGGFDERYVPAYYEDTDLAFEVRKHGFKALYNPKSVVIHFEGISNGTDLGSGIKRYQVVNKENFYEKWKEELEENHFPNAQDVFLARDRSKNKKHMLFVDHYLPHYDQDAGSKATYQYLQIFAKSNIQVHFIGDNFYDYPGTPYLDALTQMGIEVLYGSWYQKHWKEWFAKNGKYFDYVVLSRPHISVKYIDTIKEHSDAKVIYYGHDLHFLRERREYEIKQDENYLISSKKWQKVELDLVKESDVSYFFSNVEKEEIQKSMPEASVDVVPLYIYDQFKTRIKKANEREDIMFVGGFAHSPNIDAMLWFVQDIWPLVLQELPTLKLYIIGSKPTDEILALANDNVIVTGYIDDDTLDGFYNDCKVAVAPLRYGAGIKGKVIDALYNSMPLVTTSIGAEGIENAQNAMMIADAPEVFAQKVIALYQDNDLADTYAKEGALYCETYFSEAKAKQQMSHVFHEFKESE